MAFNNLTRPVAALQAKGYPSSLISCLTTSTSHSYLDNNICFNMELTISCMVSTYSPYLSTKQFFNLSTVLTSPISWLLSTSSTLSTLYQFLPTTLNFIACLICIFLNL